MVSIKPKRAAEIVDEVRAAVAKWEKFANKVGVSKKSSKGIDLILKNF